MINDTIHYLNDLIDYPWNPGIKTTNTQIANKSSSVHTFQKRNINETNYERKLDLELQIRP